MTTLSKKQRKMRNRILIAAALLVLVKLLPLTGYIHGGCSPIGMKKPFPTVLHESAADCESIYVSAGKIGYQVQLSPGDLQKMLPMKLCDVIK